MEERKAFERRLSVRIFDDEFNRMSKLILYAQDYNSERKYYNESHFIRCAIMYLISIEEKKLEKIRGRPKFVRKK